MAIGIHVDIQVQLDSLDRILSGNNSNKCRPLYNLKFKIAIDAQEGDHQDKVDFLESCRDYDNDKAATCTDIDTVSSDSSDLQVAVPSWNGFKIMGDNIDRLVKSCFMRLNM